MRSFIALELSGAAAQNLRVLQEELKSSGADVKWVEPRNIHLTLKFFADLNEKKIPAVKTAIQETTQLYRVFCVRLSELGAFPSAASPRVIWTGVSEGRDQIRAIAGTLEDKIARIGIPKEERAFAAHITIGRMRSPRNKDSLRNQMEKAGKELSARPVESQIDMLTFFSSTLTPRGPVYRTLYEAHLATI